ARECSVGSLLAVADSDGDGLLDSEELTDSGAVADTDADQIPNVLDADDDGDGVPTINEGADPNGDGSPDDAQDSDGDGLSDFLADDDDGAGVPPAEEALDGNGDPTDDDSDDDGVTNYLD